MTPLWSAPSGTLIVTTASSLLDDRPEGKFVKSSVPSLPLAAVPRVHRMTLAGVTETLKPWWETKTTLDQLSVLYQAGCISYPFTETEAFCHRDVKASREWVMQAQAVFEDRGWPLPKVDDWQGDPSLFNDQNVGAHTGIVPVFSRENPVTSCLTVLDGLSEDQVMLYRVVVLGFVHRYLDPAIRRMRLETFELRRTVEQTLNNSAPTTSLTLSTLSGTPSLALNVRARRRL